MKLRTLAVAIVVVGVVLIPTTAWAKGAKDVTITGPGLHQPVHVENIAGPTIIEVNRLAEATGLLYAAFRTTPSPITHARPAGKLGPRYRAVYELYASESNTVTIRQDLYPFAAAGFVSYTAPGQHVFQRTARSGWYVTTDKYNTGVDSPSATAMLVSLGAPPPKAKSAAYTVASRRRFSAELETGPVPGSRRTTTDRTSCASDATSIAQISSCAAADAGLLTDGHGQLVFDPGHDVRRQRVARGRRHGWGTDVG